MHVPQIRSSFQGKETKRETLLKQVKDVDELMNEELRLCFYPSWLLVHSDRFSIEAVSLHARDKTSHPLFAPWKELRNARKFVERQELFEKKYMIGSKLGEQAAEISIIATNMWFEHQDKSLC